MVLPKAADSLGIKENMLPKRIAGGDAQHHKDLKMMRHYPP